MGVTANSFLKFEQIMTYYNNMPDYELYWNSQGESAMSGVIAGSIVSQDAIMMFHNMFPENGEMAASGLVNIPDFTTPLGKKTYYQSVYAFFNMLGYPISFIPFTLVEKSLLTEPIINKINIFIEEAYPLNIITKELFNNESLYELSNLLTGVNATLFNITYGNSGDERLNDAYMINQFYKDNGNLLIKPPSYYGAYFYKSWFNQVLDLTAYYTQSYTNNVSHNVNVLKYSDYQELIIKTPQQLMSYIQNNTSLKRNKFPNGEFQMKYEYSDNYYSLPHQENAFMTTEVINNMFNIGNNKTWVITENNGIKTVTIEISGHTLVTGDHVSINSIVGAIQNNVRGIPRNFDPITGAYQYFPITNDPSFNAGDFSPSAYSVFNLPDMTFNPPQLNPSIKRGRYIVTVNGNNISFNLDTEAEATDPQKQIYPYSTPSGSYQVNFPADMGTIYLQKLVQYQTTDKNLDNYASLNHNIDIVEQTTFTTIDDNKKVLVIDFRICRILKSAVDNVATLKYPRDLGPISGNSSVWPDIGTLMTSLPSDFNPEKWSHWNKDDPLYYTWFIKETPPNPINYTKDVVPNNYGGGDIWNLDALGTPSNRINHYALDT